MASVFSLSSRTAQIAHHLLAPDHATRFDSCGKIADAAPFSFSIVAFASAPPRYALVASADADVAIGTARVSGVAELADRDRVFAGGREILVSLDALPLPVDAPVGTRCTVCDQDCSDPTREGGRSSLRACPRCGARACEDCWRGFRGGICLTPGCHQPAALDRALWRPGAGDFLDFENDVRAEPDVT